MVLQTCDQVQGHPLCHSKFDEANLGYMRSCLRKKKIASLNCKYNSLTIWTVERANCEDRKIANSSGGCRVHQWTDGTPGKWERGEHDYSIRCVPLFTSRSKTLLSSRRLLGPAGEWDYARGYREACGDGSMLMSFERVSVLFLVPTWWLTIFCTSSPRGFQSLPLSDFRGHWVVIHMCRQILNKFYWHGRLIQTQSTLLSGILARSVHLDSSQLCPLLR